MTHGIERLPLSAGTPGTRCEVMLHRFGTPGARPKAYFQAAFYAEKGQVAAGLIGPAAEGRNAGRGTIHAGTAGIIRSRRDRLYVQPGDTLAKVVGREPLTTPRAKNLLGD